MILLDYIPWMIGAIIFGAFFALGLKAFFIHRDTMKTLFLLALSPLIIVLFPIVMFKALKKDRTVLLQHINKNKQLNEEHKKEAKKIVTSDFKLFIYVTRFNFTNFRQILNVMIKKDPFKSKSVSRENKREKIVNEAESVIAQNFTKPLESYLCKSII